MVEEALEIAKELALATPEQAASIWTKVAEDKRLAIKVHDALGRAGRVSLAHKLGKISE